mgnify:FL=1
MSSNAAIRRPVAMVVCAAVGLSLFAVPEAAIAQLSVKVQTDTHQVHIGDPIQLRLRVAPLEPQQQVLFPPDFDDPWPDHVSTSRLVSPSSPPGEAVYDLRLYETGEAELRGLNIDVVDGGDTLSLQTASIRIDVLAVREEGEQDLRMIKPPWAIAGGIPVWLVAMLAALLALAIAWIVYRKMQGRTPAVIPKPVIPTDYRREFSRIEAMGLLERGAVKLYYTHLSEILRGFLEDHTEVDALERTTEEIDLDLQAHEHVDESLQQDVIGFLDDCDLVKFARAEPDLPQAKRMPDRGRQIIDDVEQIVAAAQARLETPDAVEQTA